MLIHILLFISIFSISVFFILGSSFWGFIKLPKKVNPFSVFPIKVLSGCFSTFSSSKTWFSILTAFLSFNLLGAAQGNTFFYWDIMTVYILCPFKILPDNSLEVFIIYKVWKLIKKDMMVNRSVVAFDVTFHKKIVFCIEDKFEGFFKSAFPF